jgi:hypothetical protein
LYFAVLFALSHFCLAVKHCVTCSSQRHGRHVS